jgi:hypothetical protein
VVPQNAGKLPLELGSDPLRARVLLHGSRSD